jgi:hypothetical protein
VRFSEDASTLGEEEATREAHHHVIHAGNKLKALRIGEMQKDGDGLSGTVPICPRGAKTKALSKVTEKIEAFFLTEWDISAMLSSFA